MANAPIPQLRNPPIVEAVLDGEGFAKTQLRHRPSESAAAHELAEALKVDRV